MRPFKIQTLSDRSYSRLGDPIVVSTVITAGAQLLGQLFPNIFGGSRIRLTDAMWLQIIPGNGYWTDRLRNYLKTKIHYNTDVQKVVAGTGGQTNLQWATKAFVNENQSLLGFDSGQMDKFYEILRIEGRGGGTQTGGPPSYLPGLGFSIPTEWLLIGAGVLVVILSKKKRRRK